MPGLKDLNDTTYVKENKFVDLSLQSMGDACSEGGTAAWMEIREKIKPTLEPAIVGGQSAKDAIAELGQARRGRHRPDVRTRHCGNDIRGEGQARTAAFAARDENGTEAHRSGPDGPGTAGGDGPEC